MELKFIGRGAAFNPKEGSNSAFFVDNNRLFLIDCGESVFCQLFEHKFLDKFSEINILITHTHSDHIGSLGSLILYVYYRLQKKANIIVPANGKQIKDSIKNIAYAFGCDDNMFELVDDYNYDNKYMEFSSVRLLKTVHQKEMDCYGILFNTKDGVVYYSGDTNELTNVEKLLQNDEKIDKLYMEVTTANYLGNCHLYIGFLNDLIPQKLKHKVYCMHLTSDDCIQKAKEFGFNVVENYDFGK